MQDWQATVISQYAQSAVLLGIIGRLNAAIDPAGSIDALFDLVLNLDTAQGVGLDRWGRIVGANRVLSVPVSDYFGFQTAAADWEPFGQAPFYAGSGATQNYALSDAAYRQLILVKAAANISRTTTPVLNALLGKLFPGRGRCYAHSLGQMNMRYEFEFDLEPFELAILASSGALPRPTGVQVFLSQEPDQGTFFFAEAGPDGMPFGQAPFSPGATVVT